MQLSNIKNTKTHGKEQNADGMIDYGNSCATPQREGTTHRSFPGTAKAVMSLTNVILAGCKAPNKPCAEKTTSSNDLRLRSKSFRDSRLTFNVCGEKYEVLESTVQRYPNTLLADPSRRANFWDDEYQEYYMDRNRACFESVLTYYQSNGILIRPQNIPDVLFLKELQFYDLGDEVLQKVRGEGPEQPKTTKPIENDVPSPTLQGKVWDLFEHPETSPAARFIAWFSCTVVLLSIIMFCIETLPEFRKKDSSGKTKNYQTFFIIETLCIAWFTFEYITRLISSPNKWKFVKEALNVIDLVAILPFFLNFAFSEGSNMSSVAILRAVRLVRVFRVFKLSRYSSGLRILGLTLRASVGELGLLVFFLSVGVVLFASAIYYAEMGSDNNAFDSIPHSFWWAIVTMTTVGYGDMYPTTLIGKFIGSLCACTGILAIALPVPVIVANFERFYSQSQQEAKSDSQDGQKKAAKYKALKKFFDRLRNRENMHSGDEREEEYYDMGGEIGQEARVSSDGSEHEYSLLEKKNVHCASSV